MEVDNTKHTMKQRTYYLDNISCLLLFHMIYTHHIACSCGGYYPFTINIIGATLSFFMSWFFYKGGMMHKISFLKDIIVKSSKRLLIPYVIFLGIGLLIESIIKFTNDKELTLLVFLREEISNFLLTAIFWPTAATWFLLSLFVVRLSFNYLVIKVHPVCITVFFMMVGYVIYIINYYGRQNAIGWTEQNMLIEIPDYFGNICHGLSLYSLGYYMKEKQFNKFFFIPALLLFVLKFFIPAGIDFRTNISYGVNYLMAVIYGMAGCIVINNIFRHYANVKITLFTYVGNNSMVYYLIHYPVIYTTIFLFWNPYKDLNIQIRFFILSVIVTLFLFIAEWLFRYKKIRFIIGG